MEPNEISDRSRGVALALCSVIGPFGGHRFYVGKVGTGLAMLCTFGGLGIWWLYDIITVAAGGFRDVEGKRVWRWAEPGSLEGTERRNLTHEQTEAIFAELDALRMDVSELAERTDFMERMLTREKAAGRIPPGTGGRGPYE